VLLIVALIVLFGLLLAGVLTAWALWFQAYIYTEASPGLAWRGPAAAGGVLAVVVLWAVFDYHAPGRYRPFWEASSTEESPPISELRVPNVSTGGVDVYKPVPGRREYRIGGLPTGNPLPNRPTPYVIAVEGEDRKEAKFAPERDEAGKYVQRERKSWFGGATKEPVRYLDEGGRVMYEGALGYLSETRGSWFFGNLLLHVLLFAACFVGLWALVRFQWPHALGQAVVLWLMLLFALAPLLTRVERVAQERAAEARQAERATEGR
jgi:hypothetical protein